MFIMNMIYFWDRPNTIDNEIGNEGLDICFTIDNKTDISNYILLF
jgi:hypothetical protein